MKHLIKLMIILGALLAGLASLGHADSPITSANISDAYMDVEMVQEAKKLGSLNQSLADYLSKPEVGIDVKAAVLNALGWGERKQNAQAYASLVLGKSLDTVSLDSLTGEELFCLGYLMALDDYFNPGKALPVLEKAKEKLKDSFTVAMITALVDAQGKVFSDTNSEPWTQFVELIQQHSLKQDMRPQAVKVILYYMYLYNRSLGVDPGLIAIEEGKTANAAIFGNGSPFKVKESQVINPKDPAIYTGLIPSTSFFSPDAKSETAISGNSLSVKGIHPGIMLLTLEDKNKNFTYLPVLITPAIPGEITKNKMILSLGYSYAYINNQKIKLDTKVPGTAPLLKNGRTLVPVRFISESFGAKVAWDAKTSTATITKDTTVIKLRVGSSNMLINQKEVVLDVPCEIIGGRLFIPLRRIAEDAFNQKIYYQAGLIVIGDTPLILEKENEPYILRQIQALFEK